MKDSDVLYLDNSVIVVKKKANILSQEDNTLDTSLLTLVKGYVKKKYNKPGNVYIGLVHRLDRPVSGIMVFARNSKSASRLSKEIRDNKIKKTYIAVVHGIIKSDSGKLTDYLLKKSNGDTIVTTEDNGKIATLFYKVIDRDYDKKQTLVEIHLETGRHHQIRVQFASRGYPLCGDQRYGRRDKTQIALCAYKLEFVHPVSKEIMKFEIPFPNNIYFNNFTKK